MKILIIEEYNENAIRFYSNEYFYRLYANGMLSISMGLRFKKGIPLYNVKEIL